MTIDTTLFTDPGCPWAYSASPALTVLRWRYRDQLDWRLVVIGLSETRDDYLSKGFTPERQALSARIFRNRFGMPIAAAPRAALSATGRACRALVATRLLHPGREFAALRALQLAWFNSDLELDQDSGLEAALARVPGIDAQAVVALLDAETTAEAYAADHALARTAGGSPTEFQDKAAVSDGLVRYTAPSVQFNNGTQMLEAGGFQSIEAYDVLIANLDRSLTRTPPPADPLEALAYFDGGLVTQEVALLLSGHLEAAARPSAEDALIKLAAAGEVKREALGDDALWMLAA